MALVIQYGAGWMEFYITLGSLNSVFIHLLFISDSIYA